MGSSIRYGSVTNRVTHAALLRANSDELDADGRTDPAFVGMFCGRFAAGAVEGTLRAASWMSSARCRRARPGCTSSVKYVARRAIRNTVAVMLVAAFSRSGSKGNGPRVRASAMRGKHKSVPFESGNHIESGAEAPTGRTCTSAT